MSNDELYVDTGAVGNAADEMNQIAGALASVSELAKAALTSLADYDSPVYSAEIKSSLQTWISNVGDPENLGADGATMISRMKDFAGFLRTVAAAYTA